MNLKELVEADVFGVFLNPDEMADWHEVNGTRLLCAIDKNNVHMRTGGGRRTEGVREDSLFLYIASDAFRNKPVAHEPITVDGKRYKIRDVSDEFGMLVIEYGDISDGRRKPIGRPNAP